MTYRNALLLKILVLALVTGLLGGILQQWGQQLHLSYRIQKAQAYATALSERLAAESPEQWAKTLSHAHNDTTTPLFITPIPAVELDRAEIPASLEPFVIDQSGVPIAASALDNNDVINRPDNWDVLVFEIPDSQWDLTLWIDVAPNKFALLTQALLSLLFFTAGLFWITRPLAKGLDHLAKSITPTPMIPAQQSPEALANAVEASLHTLRKTVQLNHEEWRDLLHGVAHELRSPLARIQFAIAEWHACDPQEREELESHIDKAIEEVDDLVRETLEYSRMELGKPEDSAYETVDAVLLLESATQRLHALYPSVTFQLLGPRPFLIHGHKKQLDRAFINLLRNAARYGESRIEIQFSRQDDAHWQLIIDDDGPGIPPGKRERIFEPFTRLDPSRSRDSGGSGLGLAIVKAILDNHNATIRVEDSPLGGARFIAYF